MNHQSQPCWDKTGFNTGYVWQIDQVDTQLRVRLQPCHGLDDLWDNDILPLTYIEKAALWFLVVECGLDLLAALQKVENGFVIFQGTKHQWATRWFTCTGFFANVPGVFRTYFDTSRWLEDQVTQGSLIEFEFGHDTWCASPKAI